MMENVIWSVWLRVVISMVLTVVFARKLDVPLDGRETVLATLSVILQSVTGIKETVRIVLRDAHLI